MKQLNPNKINRSAVQWYFPLSYCSLVILTKTSRLPVLLISRLSFCFQCDEMLEWKVDQILLKHSKKYSKEFLLNKWLLQNIPQSLGLFGLLFKEYLLPKSLKNWPIWSHWSQRFGHTDLFYSNGAQAKYIFATWQLFSHKFYLKNVPKCSGADFIIKF